jgi:hypothetical protein
MIPEEIMLFMLLGTMTSATMGFFVTEGKELKTIILLAFQGLFTGLLAGYFWIIFTGGLDIDLFAMTMPVIVSAGLSYILLYYMPRSIGRSNVNINMSRACAVALVILMFFIIFSAVPIAYKSSINTQVFSVNTQDWNPTDDTDCGCAPTEAIPINIETKYSSADAWTLAEKPSEGRYLDFKITFESKGIWKKPYLKMAVYKDTNGNGQLDDTDIMWDNANCKIGTTYSKWRANAIWEGGKPTSVLTIQGRMLPIFHAEELSSTVDESGKTLYNTPEKFVPQNDMMTWEGTSLKDQVVTYASVDTDETTTLQGTLYCNYGTVGKNLIVVQAYDAESSDPFSNEYPAIKEEIIPFEVTKEAQPANLMGIPLNGGVILLIGILGMAFVVISARSGKKWL